MSLTISLISSLFCLVPTNNTSPGGETNHFRYRCSTLLIQLKHTLLAKHQGNRAKDELFS